jgi:heparan-alpha-glucosaminide N-acetyltransferase
VSDLYNKPIEGSSAWDGGESSPTLTGPADKPANMRLPSIDIYRGMVMFLMLAEVMHLYKLREVFDQDNIAGRIAEWIRFHTSHVEWVGCSLHDMIQPSFTFLVGVSLVFSIASRISKGQTKAQMLVHALWRSFALVFLGIFLRSLGKPQTNFTFDDTLTQIGLGYCLLFLVAGLSTRSVVAILVLVLVGYWGAFITYPKPSEGFDYAAVGVPADWGNHWKEGLLVHFNKNSNLAWAFDRWWMNLFPRPTEFLYSGGGYATLSFVPTFGTMLLGLLAGRMMKSNNDDRRRIGGLMLVGSICMLVGYGLDWLGVCPVVKRIWTSSWVLWSGGLCFVWLAVLSQVCDVWKFTAWGGFFTVVGANSIVAYVMSWTLEGPVIEAMKRHFGAIFSYAADRFATMLSSEKAGLTQLESLFYGVSVLVVFWIVLLWLYRQRIFVRI